MIKIFTEETIQNLPYRSLDELMKNYLRKDHILTRSMSIIQIALTWGSNYNKYSKLLLEEMNEHLHFESPKLGISSAWTIAVVLAENLKSSDYSILKSEFDTWPKEEREGLLNWIKDFPEQSSILKNGRII